MGQNKRKLDTPYTKDELEKTAASVNQHIKDAVYSVILAYLHEFQPEYTHDNGAESIVNSVLPVVLCLIEDGMLSGQDIAEHKIMQQLYEKQALFALSKLPPSSSRMQN
jgi:hypothetical protein